MKQVGVLALQGAFIEHEKMLEQLGVSCIELRNKEDLEKPYDGIILPGGESTVQGKLLKELDMFDTIKKQIEAGMPVLATCAGLFFLQKILKIRKKHTLEQSQCASNEMHMEDSSEASLQQKK